MPSFDRLHYQVPTAQLAIARQLTLAFTVILAAVLNTSSAGAMPTSTEYPVPTSSSGPAGITAGPDGNVWFTELQAGKVAKVTTGGAVTEYAIPTPNAGPLAITVGPDGNLWFTENGEQANKVANVTPGGTFTEYSLPTQYSGPESIAAGPDGNLWFTESWTNGNKVAKITTSGTLTEYTTDPARNTGTSTSYTWRVDTTAPTVTITAYPENPTNKTWASFSFSATDIDDASGLTFTCALDSNPAAACTSPVRYTSLSTGSHTFTVRATDPAGNTGSATYAWVIAH